MSNWDAATLEASGALSSTVVGSEILESANDFDGIRVDDPFVAESADC